MWKNATHYRAWATRINPLHDPHMNVYGDVVSDEMAVASGKVAGLALNGR